MKPESEPLTIHQSLNLITTMINQAKGNVQHQSFHFLLWGWIIILANIGVFILAQFHYPHPYLMWSITLPGLIISIYYSLKKRKEDGAISHFSKIMGWLWFSFALTILVYIIFMNKLNFNINPIIITLTAIPTFASGMVMRFRPLIIGGICFWILGSVAFLVVGEWQNLIGALAFLVGYLIPGYLIKFKENA